MCMPTQLFQGLFISGGFQSEPPNICDPPTKGRQSHGDRCLMIYAKSIAKGHIWAGRNKMSSYHKYKLGLATLWIGEIWGKLS